MAKASNCSVNLSSTGLENPGVRCQMIFATFMPHSCDLSQPSDLSDLSAPGASPKA